MVILNLDVLLAFLLIVIVFLNLNDLRLRLILQLLAFLVYFIRRLNFLGLAVDDMDLILFSFFKAILLLLYTLLCEIVVIVFCRLAFGLVLLN